MASVSGEAGRIDNVLKKIRADPTLAADSRDHPLIDRGVIEKFLRKR